MLAVDSILHRPLERALGLAGRWYPQQLFARYARLARAAGINDLCLSVSLDCDTPEDLDVVERVCRRLMRMGIYPSLAVPGQLLRQGAPVFRKLAGEGLEFLNHGGVQHTRKDADSGRYYSHFFYDQLTAAAAEEDILQGDAAIREVLGQTPAGFRTPHFGTFQHPRQLAWLHALLKRLGYRFSSSTVPLYGFRFGPLFRRQGVWEIPLAGMGAHPMTALDTWSCFAAPARRFTPQDYAQQAEAWLLQLRRFGCGIINCYADPCHIDGEGCFFDVMQRLALQAKPVTYAQLLQCAGADA